MDADLGVDVVSRLAQLEKRIAVERWLLAGVAIVCVVLACARASAQNAASPSASAPASGVLRVRGIVIEDEQGRPRLLLGAPVPTVAERVRKDAASGLVLLDEKGIDRLQLGHVGGPQMGGTVNARNSPATGLMVNDAKGNERGGFGVFENGQVGWGLDYDGREGLVAIVDPARGVAGFVLTADSEENPMRAMLLSEGEATVWKMFDGKGVQRTSLEAIADVPAALDVFDSNGERVSDAFED